MYKEDILKLIKEIDCELKISDNEYDKDLRSMGIDSIAFIRFLALFEERFNFEFDYGFLDEFKVVSITVLDDILKRNR